MQGVGYETHLKDSPRASQKPGHAQGYKYASTQVSLWFKVMTTTVKF